ncbi:MAG: sensor histidine kinase [Gemmatimonadales bacterium]
MAEAHFVRRLVGADYSPRIRAERLIATSRVVLAGLSLMAVWLDPYRPVSHEQTLYLLLLGYLVFALAAAAFVWLGQEALVVLGFVTHLVDISLFSLLTYFTEGPTSPFFIYFMFSMVGATLRWQWRGALWTAAAALIGFNGVSVYASEVMDDPAFEENRFVIRSVYLAVMAWLLGYLGAYEERRRREMSALAAWPGALVREPEIPPGGILESAARILGAPRVLLIWEEPDEPWLHFASWSNGEFRSWREAPATFQPVIAEPLAGLTFLSKDVRAPVPVILRRAPDEPRGWRGAPVHPALQSRFAMAAVLCLPLHGECMDGHLFALDKRRMTSDDLLLGEVVARQVVSSVDQSLLSRRLRQTAAAEERIRLSRDLHDGVLQSLTGAALQLETVQRLWDSEPAAARGQVGAIQRLIGDEQRNLRGFIRDSKLAPAGLTAGTEGLQAGLRDLVRRLEDLWGLRVALEVDRLHDPSSDALVYDLCLIVQEALVNAARHAAASEVHVRVASEDGQVHIVVTDNGRGFGFQGDYDHAKLTALGLGPVMLKERVKSLGGSLAIHSTPAGARLDIFVPAEPKAN